MITVTLGTIAYPFERAIDWISIMLQREIIQEPVFLQHGASAIDALEEHPLVTAVPTIQRESLENLVDRSRLVIAHAGQGTTRMLIERQCRFVLLPRLSRKGEHVDNHQLIFARSNQGLGVCHCLELPELEAAIATPPPPVETKFFDGPRLSTYLLQKYPAYPTHSSALESVQSVDSLGLS